MESNRQIVFVGSSKIVFTSLEESRKLVSTSDAYSKILTKFDIQAKVKTLRTNVNEIDYLDNAKKYVLNWFDYEIEYLTEQVLKLKSKIESLNLKFSLPEKIYLIKSTMREEGGASGFTRGNYIVLNQNSLSIGLLEHELFHIISRYNNVKSGEAYSILGFKKCNEVLLPNELQELKITNPDAIYNNYYITIKYKSVLLDAIMIIYSEKPYEGGGFFKYLNENLLIVDGKEDAKQVKYENGKIQLLEYDKVENLLEQIGRNTNYNINQEEISADHFTFVLDKAKNLPDQGLVDKLLTVLQK